MVSLTGRIIKALSGFYYVQTEDGLVECKARGKFRKEGISPLVGDMVNVTIERGTASLGTGAVHAYVYLPEEAFDMEQEHLCPNCGRMVFDEDENDEDDE